MPEAGAEAIKYVLTATITAPDGTTATVTYEHTVPKYVLVSFEDYMAAEEGTTVVIDHGDGLKTVYRFVTEAEGVKVGDEVEKGELIATVAEANGNEYKDGAHLHFEILQNGKNVDPALHLTLEEK